MDRVKGAHAAMSALTSNTTVFLDAATQTVDVALADENVLVGLLKLEDH